MMLACVVVVLGSLAVANECAASRLNSLATGFLAVAGITATLALASISIA